MSIEWLLRNLAVSLVLPPLNAIVAGLLALVLWRRYPRAARALVVLSTVGLWLQCTPAVTQWLQKPLLPAPLHAPADIKPAPQAIVVLGGGVQRGALEYAGTPAAAGTDATLGQYSLERVRYAAWLARETGLPVLVSGGAPDERSVAEAVLMKQALETEYRVPVRWVESRSTTTMENARLSAPMLAQSGVTRIFLVTDAWHMRRAVRNFERAGLAVVSAPCGFGSPSDADGRLPFWPTGWAMMQTRLALHEWLGGWLGR